MQIAYDATDARRCRRRKHYQKGRRKPGNEETPGGHGLRRRRNCLHRFGDQRQSDRQRKRHPRRGQPRNGGKDHGLEGETKYEKEKVFDGNILTGFRSVAPDDGWVGMKLKERTTVSRIRFIARNDGNCIEVGDVYELVYWQDGKWKSRGRQKADSNKLTFRKVPSCSLYLVHNLTKGSEERIFTYENGKQIWW